MLKAPPEAPATPALLRLHAVAGMTSLSEAELRRRRKARRMPRPRVEERGRDGRPRTVLWAASDIELWCELGLPDEREFERQKADRRRSSRP